MFIQEKLFLSEHKNWFELSALKKAFAYIRFNHTLSFFSQTVSFETSTLSQETFCLCEVSFTIFLDFEILPNFFLPF